MVASIEFLKAIFFLVCVANSGICLSNKSEIWCSKARYFVQDQVFQITVTLIFEPGRITVSQYFKRD